jgi:4-nitrophenyl phosphatase
LAEALASATPQGEVVDIGGVGGAEVGAAALESSAGAGTGFDAVVVGLTRNFNYGILDVAATAVRGGARLLASNADTTFPGASGLPGSGGLHPGGGSLVAAVEAASGRPAVVAGKPNEAMAIAIRKRFADWGAWDRTGAGPNTGAQAVGGSGVGAGGIVVGDRAETDGRLAEILGWPFALVLSGVTTRSDLPVEVPVEVVGETLADVVAQLGRKQP